MSDDLLQRFDETVRRHGRCIGRSVEYLRRATRVTGPTADMLDNMILWSDLDGSTADDEIDEHVDYFVALGHNFQWLTFSHDRPPDLVDRLLARGFEHESQEEVVLANSKQIGEQPPLPGIELRKIDVPAQVADVLVVQNQVWGDAHHDFVKRWLTDLVVDTAQEHIVLVAYDKQKPVAAAWATLRNDRPFAPLFGGTVLPRWRGRGIYRALVAARARAAAARGIEWCYADAGTDSLPILQHLGFRSFTRRVCLRWNAARDEYAARRLAFE